jgi:hypothetical protein
MRYALVVLLGMLCWVSPAAAQVSIGIGLPGVSIGINMGSYPELAPVPNYPVYYAPKGDVNLFFYDGMYWAYQRDSWYASSWYNGPWGLVGPEAVPAFVLRIPVRYYRHPPAAWAGWQRDAPPRWGERWGQEWEQHRKGWNQWDRHAAQTRAPLPVYQRQYSGNRYPREEQQQQVLLRDKYRYQPKEPVVREHYQQHGALPQPGERRQQPNQRSSAPPPQQSARPVSRSQPAQGEGEGVQRSAPAPAPPHQGGPAVQRQQPQPVVIHHEPAAPKSEGQQDRPQGKGQDKADTRQPQHGPEQGQEQERGQGRNK